MLSFEIRIALKSDKFIQTFIKSDVAKHCGGIVFIH
jgi:hypothetical protein